MASGFRCQKTFLAALGINLLFIIGFEILTRIDHVVFPENNTLHVTLYIVTQVLKYLLIAGIVRIGLMRALDRPVSFELMFKPFEWKMMLNLCGLFLLNVIYYFILFLFFIPIFVVAFEINPHINMILYTSFLFHLMHLPLLVESMRYFATQLPFWLQYSIAIGSAVVGLIIMLFIAIRLFAAFFLILDKELPVFTAIIQSFQLSQHKFSRIALMLISKYCIALLVFLPIGLFLAKSSIVYFLLSLVSFISFIWMIPFLSILNGKIYQYIAYRNAI